MRLKLKNTVLEFITFSEERLCLVQIRKEFDGVDAYLKAEITEVFLRPRGKWRAREASGTDLSPLSAVCGQGVCRGVLARVGWMGT